MGAQVSKVQSTQQIMNDVITNVLVNSSSTCTAQNTSNQTITFENISATGCEVTFSDISQGANISLNLQCASDTANEQALNNQFKSQFEQQLQAQNSGLTVGFSQAQTDSYQNALTTIKNNINISTIAVCAASSVQNQLQQYSKIQLTCTDSQIAAGTNKLTFNNLSQFIVASVVANCVSTNKSVVDATNTIDSLMKSKANASVAGIDLTSITTVWIIVIIGVILLCSFVSSGLAVFANTGVGERVVNRGLDYGEAYLNRKYAN